MRLCESGKCSFDLRVQFRLFSDSLVSLDIAVRFSFAVGGSYKLRTMFYILAFLVVLGLLVLDMRKPKNFPKGPSWLPLIGSALSVAKSRKETGMLIKGIKKISEETAEAENVIGFKIGKTKVVFAVSTPAILEMYNNPDLDGRPKGPFFETRTWNLRRGIILTDGEFWVTQRRFITRHLKGFGYARKGMREICENEAEFCLNDLRKLVALRGGKCAMVKMSDHFSVYILNTLWLMMAGIRYDANDKNLKPLQDLLSDLFAQIDMMGALFSHFPFLRFIAPGASGYNSFVSCHDKFHNFVRGEVENHKKTFNPSDEPRDLIDAYLKVLYSGDDDGKTDESFSELQLLAVCMDMFMSGTETTNKSVNFMFLHLVRNQKVQEKARKEIDQVVGRTRLPTLEDRVNLPYCDAIVHEAVRIFMSFTCGIAHRALRDTKLSGFDVPKDTMVISMFSGSMNYSEIIKNPHAFDPENFLDENGNISIPDKHFPFGLGKHRCIGDMLARSNLFIMCTTLLQNFYLTIPPGHDIPSETPLEGATASIVDYEALIIPRD